MRAPAASSDNARNTMRANGRVSGVERRLRSALWAVGARGYRVQSTLPGRPDVVFPREQVAVFIHGCFWHGCPTCRLPLPKANADFWADKFRQNQARDAEVERLLRAADWVVVVVWEHEVSADREAVARALVAIRSARTKRPGHAALPARPHPTRPDPEES